MKVLGKDSQVNFLEISKHLPGDQGSEKILRNKVIICCNKPIVNLISKRNYSRKLNSIYRFYDKSFG